MSSCTDVTTPTPPASTASQSARCRFHAGPATGNGLVIGCGGAPLTRVACGCRTLHQILAGTDGWRRRVDIEIAPGP